MSARKALTVIAVLLAVTGVHAQESSRQAQNKEGRIALDQGKVAEAERLFRASIKEAESAGVEDKHLAYALGGLGEIFYRQRKYTEAQPYFVRSLEIYERLGISCTVPAYANLAANYEAQGKYAEAESYLHRSIAFGKKDFGEDHPFVTLGMSQLAQIYRTQGRDAEAEKLFQQALAILDKMPGADYVQGTPAILFQFASLEQKLQKFDEAIRLLRRAMAIWEKKLPYGHANSLPADHPTLAYARRALAVLLEIQGQTNEAAKLDSQALEVLRKRPRSGDTAESQRLTKEGDTAFENGDYVRAEARYRSAIGLYEQALGPDDAKVAQTYDQFARILDKQGREKEAAVFARRADRIRAQLPK
jgi:tetratricopeptide (TPR) repeat protein